ncbi:NTP transferase domain-containing protein [Desulfosporosinus sp. BICA1-9]|uniref:nucleotidyltransferase family protein n=1 Tax=Desulfosporosinus sp. BICA1-9 TaxID=1531958 RepID=UPI00054BB621|nr:nucleotidyltransferase family protein [Desulfosporosinus sp. BICA1-9]KJS88052.1 MAG: molybdopterin-guanine dinucleotide biosynthesis protein MobA [Desulfosporosinus sp. BICA1-9]HBW34607.1 nucleotidyltransferase family protein [Desulfosporosinus sp.]
MVRFVVMAAGLATRMGQDKLALPWKEATVLAYVLQTVLEGIELQHTKAEVFVVARQPIERYIPPKGIARFKSFGGIWYQAPGPQPLAETIRMGLQDLNPEVQEVGFLPGDQVGISVQCLSACLQAVFATQPDFLVPMAGEKAGSPVFFHRRYLSELLELKGEQGGREVLYRYPERWSKFPVEEHIFQDVDTPEEYRALLKLNLNR